MPKMMYIGKGAWLPGVPARDLSPEEVERYGGVTKLRASGLYVPQSKPAPKETKLAQKEDEVKQDD